MRLFGKVDGAVNRFDRATWLTGGPWGGFDIVLSSLLVTPVLRSRNAAGAVSPARASSTAVLARSSSTPTPGNA